MNTIKERMPAYGMPVLEGPLNKPEPVDVRAMMLVLDAYQKAYDSFMALQET